MATVKAEDKEKYLESARTWEYDRMRAAIQSRRVAWTVAGQAPGAAGWVRGHPGAGHSLLRSHGVRLTESGLSASVFMGMA